MKSIIIRASLAVLALLVSAPGWADTQALTTSDGGTVHVSPTIESNGRFDLSYEVVDGLGRHFGGQLPAALPVMDASAVALSQNPVTGDIFLINSAWHVSPGDVDLREANFDLQLRVWQGQAWSDAVWLTPTIGVDELEPTLTFNAIGEAILVWQEVGGFFPGINIRYGYIGPEGMDSVLYMNVGDIGLYLQGVGGDVRVKSGVAKIVIHEESTSAYVLLSDPVLDQVAILDLPLSVLREVVGVHTWPVPVTLTSGGFDPLSDDDDSTDVPGSDLSGDPVAEGLDVGRWIAPHWGSAMGGELFYWFEDGYARGFAIREGEATRVISVSTGQMLGAEQSHLFIVSSLMTELGRMRAFTPTVGQRGEVRGARRRPGGR